MRTATTLISSLENKARKEKGNKSALWAELAGILEAKLSSYPQESKIDRLRAEISLACRDFPGRVRTSISWRCRLAAGRPSPACAMPCNGDPLYGNLASFGNHGNSPEVK